MRRHHFHVADGKGGIHFNYFVYCRATESIIIHHNLFVKQFEVKTTIFATEMNGIEV